MRKNVRENFHDKLKMLQDETLKQTEVFEPLYGNRLDSYLSSAFNK